MVNETMVEKHEAERIQELEAINAEMLEVLEALLHREKIAYGNTIAAQQHFAKNYAKELAVIAKAKGTAR